LNSSNKVAKFRKRKDINIGIIVFLIIFVYVLISVYIYFSKDHLSIYEVKEGSTSDENLFTGLIIRDEKVITTDKAGYINYYHNDGDRISKDSTVYSIDENKSTYDLIGNSEGSATLTDKDTLELKKEISNFQKIYQNSNYSTVYDFKYNLESTVLEITNENMLSKLQSVLNDTGTSPTFGVVKANSSGIITYSIDNMEEVSADSVTADNFSLDNYNKTQLRTLELIESKSSVYKIVTKDDWNILLLLDKGEYKKLKEKDMIKITFADDGLTTTVPITVFKKKSDYFAKLDLDKYMIRYLNQRYVKIELAINSAEGLKIPVSSIVNKDFYKIPLEYFTLGADTGNKGIVKETYNDNGDVKLVFVPTEIYYSDDTYGYIDARLFNVDSWIRSTETDERFQVNLITSLKGAFNVNKGYATFRIIEILYKNEEYCIIKNGTQYGLSVYDHIALNNKTAVEQEIIY